MNNKCYMERNDRKCPECGKIFDIPYPEAWAYKARVKKGKYESPIYYCSWTCMRAAEQRKEDKMAGKIITPEVKDKVCEMLRKGQDPKPYLLNLGSKSPSAHLAYIKKQLKQAEEPARVKIDGPIRIETPEKKDIQVTEVEKVPKPGEDDQQKQISVYKVTGIMTEYGEFRRDTKFNCIDWRNHEGDEVSMAVTGWKNLAYELPDILEALEADPE